jgi:hypothetical protein
MFFKRGSDGYAHVVRVYREGVVAAGDKNQGLDLPGLKVQEGL